jgi:hypothetical protein
MGTETLFSFSVVQRWFCAAWMANGQQFNNLSTPIGWILSRFVYHIVVYVFIKKKEPMALCSCHNHCSFVKVSHLLLSFTPHLFLLSSA